MLRVILFISLNFFLSYAQGQVIKNYQQDSTNIRTFFDTVLLNGECYQNLHFLCKNIGHRLTGSEGSKKAVVWAEDVMQQLHLDRVFKQEFLAPHWVRGKSEFATLYLDSNVNLEITALGGSIGTNGMIRAEVIVVEDIQSINDFTDDEIKGKIVLFNKAMDKRVINTFNAYGACVSQRFNGASEAAQKGAVGVLVRSLTTLTDHYPHSGVMAYKENIEKIPAAAVSTRHADLIALHSKNHIEIGMYLECEDRGLTTTHNVIGEIKGKEHPKKVIIVGGHLDSWDLGEGAHDDGAGVVQSIEVLRLFKLLNIEPRHTIRAVAFMNEENGNAGGKYYAEQAKLNKEYHIFALETDRGGFTPRGFTFQCYPKQLEKIQQFAPLLKPYYLNLLEKGYGGVDIGPLKNAMFNMDSNLILSGLMPDSQRYFDIHHTDNDVFENVNQRELELGAGAMAALIYLIDQYWEELQE